MQTRRLEVLLPADVSARDYAAFAHAVWALLDTSGFGEGGSLTPDDCIGDGETDEYVDPAD
ncbi:hypothetical protein [Saccharothrix sp. NRRL B-16314]|uniref:hypothetical protein n=1 Tax=Saccharothrix sp. NRRL B-16314 TaxID=1463825 RepID=UPI000A71E3C2|nr:hypothetical protein [Saccharothrix sp. NRRL B-16314]